MQVSSKHPCTMNIMGDGLGPQPVSNLDPAYQTPTKTKHTCELLAVVQVQAGEFHALEHLNVAWGNGVGGGRVRRDEEGSLEAKENTTANCPKEDLITSSAARGTEVEGRGEMLQM